jgi:predicted transcriptional regulator of viral defense system
MVVNLRKLIQVDVFSYVQLSDALRDYANIRTKIGRLIRTGEIIRIKKGLYTFPEYLRRSPLNPCVVANILYGHSYVSCDYALSYYGMIPENVELICSMTTGRSRSFATPVGNYCYYQHNAGEYSIGIELVKDSHGDFLIASREKAVYDKVITDKRFDGSDVANYLFDDLRLDEEMIAALNHQLLMDLRQFSRGRMTKLLDFLLEQVNE